MYIVCSTMGGCSILGCKSRTEKANSDVTFHSFPKDIDIKNVWINATSRQNWQPTRSSKICSIHFDNDEISIANKFRRIKPEAIPTPVVSLEQPDMISVNPSISLAVASTSQECVRDQNQPCTNEFVTTPNRKRKQAIISPKNTQKRLRMTVATTRKEKLLKLKFQKTKQLSAKRLRKLRAVREVNRRLNKKNAHLQTILQELKCKMKVNSEDKKFHPSQ